MKLTYITLFFFSIVLLRAANPSADNRPQEELSYLSIASQIIATPERAMILADSAKKLGLIPEYRAQIIHSRAYTRLKEDKKALEYALAAFHTDSVQNNSNVYMYVCQLLANCYIELSRQSEAIEYATKAIHIAHDQNNKPQETRAMITISRAQRELAQNDKALATLDQAIELLDGSADPKDLLMLVSLYTEKLQILMIQKKCDEAINTGKKTEVLIENMKRTGDMPETRADMQLSYVYSLLCEAYQLVGKEQTASSYYQKFLSTEFARNPQGRTGADHYLLLIKDYKQVIYNTLERERLTPAQDTINKDYTVILDKLKDAYFLMGDYKTALQYSDRLSNIRKELYARDKENAAMELAIAYETNEKETKIIKQEMELKQRNTFLGASLGIIILLILLLWITYRNSQVIKRKNKITVNQVNQLLAYKNELLAIKERDKEAELSRQEKLPKLDKKPQLDPDQPIDQDTFILLEEIMHKEKLYLKSDLTREEVLKRLRMDKNRFSRMIQSNTGDNYTNYIGNLRMEHSIQLMKQYPYYTLEAIALDSGLGNVRALHRLFQNKIGMTPTEYKKALHVN